MMSAHHIKSSNMSWASVIQVFIFSVTFWFAASAVRLWAVVDCVEEEDQRNGMSPSSIDLAVSMLQVCIR